MNIIDALQLLRDQLAAMFLLTIVITKLVIGVAKARTSLLRPAGPSRGAAAVALACAVLVIAISRESVCHPQATRTLDAPASNRMPWRLVDSGIVAGVVDGGMLLGLAGIVYPLAGRTDPAAGDSSTGKHAEPEGKRRCG